MNTQQTQEQDLAALGYVWILSVFVFFARRESAFVRFHAKQGIVLFVLSIPIWFIPYVGHYVELIILALSALGFVGAAQGQWKQLPLIGRISRHDMPPATVPQTSPELPSLPVA